MKWIIYSIILGIAEVWSIGELHGVRGTSKLVGLYVATTEEIQKLKPMVYVGIYFPALVLIAITGIVSDIIGTLLVFPVLSNRLLVYKMNKAIINASK